jgi:hypothetical protein
MAMPLITTSDPIVGENHPRYPDYKNQAARYIAANMLIEHNSDGTHIVTNRLRTGQGVYTGDGTSPRVFSSEFSPDETPVLLLIWTAGATFKILRMDTFPANTSVSLPSGDDDGGDSILSFQAGGFTLGGGAHVNDSGPLYYYAALLKSSATGTYTGDAGAGSDPDWIEHGEALTGGTGTAIANKVENHIYNTAFLHEHDDNGKHTSSPFNAWCETGTYTANNTDDRTIALASAELQIKFLLICNLTSPFIVWCSSSMPSDRTKVNATAAFSLDYIQSLGTGEFQVGTLANTTINGTHHYIAIGGR